ncbi:hypothetical protein EV421DRAFT_1214967 [Armillaria borealis]|uniref:F-box domain-containing protein n=1 Tax=Armillaria borealis TaxID=47425 RepID=A0AA39J409_9AGAR|nr:hypothetical protein EV421DRAFT_1214967 [Armillaria borealis]
MSSKIATLSDICAACGSITQGTFSGDAPSPRISELLRSNDVPSDSELSNFRDIIKQGPRRIANLDQKIARTKAFLDTLCNDRDLVEANIADAKVLSSPVRRLPSDILRSIALETIPSPSEIMSIFPAHDSLNTRISPWTLSQVCRTWRLTIVGSPELWSSILLEIRSGFDDPVSSIGRPIFLLGLHLERSRNAPLTLLIGSVLSDMDHPFLSLISSRASSIENLYFSSSSLSEIRGLTRSRGSWNMLYHLRIATFGIRHVQEIYDMFEYAPNLRVVDMSVSEREELPLIPWVQLIRLTLQVHNMQDLELLRQAKNITSLEIYGPPTWSMMPEGYEAVSLPLLTFLTLRDQSAIISSLFIPNLTSLSLSWNGQPVFPQLKIPNVITTLKITRSVWVVFSSGDEDICAFPGLPSLLKSVPYLRRLVIESCKALSLTDITALMTLPSCTPLSRLQILDLRDCTLEFDHSKFVEMVTTRRLGNKPGIDRLETVHLNGPLSLNGVCKHTWQSLCDEGLKVTYGKS